jgi:hypothetical protein
MRSSEIIWLRRLDRFDDVEKSRDNHRIKMNRERVPKSISRVMES